MTYIDFSYLTRSSCVQWLPSRTPTQLIRVRFLSDWLLYHGDNRGRHSANHNLLPDMHLCVPVLRVTTCLTELVQDVREVFF